MTTKILFPAIPVWILALFVATAMISGAAGYFHDDLETTASYNGE